MSIYSQLLSFVFALMLIACVLYVIFGQVTIRKLRKNPKTKNALGLEFVSGWDIINVAQALALPKALSEKLDRSRISFLYSNSNIVRKSTNTLDKILGALFYWIMILSGFLGILLLILNSFGLFS